MKGTTKWVFLFCAVFGAGSLYSTIFKADSNERDSAKIEDEDHGFTTLEQNAKTDLGGLPPPRTRRQLSSIQPRGPDMFKVTSQQSTRLPRASVGEQGNLCGREALEKFLRGGVELASISILSNNGTKVFYERDAGATPGAQLIELDVGQSIQFDIAEVSNSSSRRFYFNARAFHLNNEGQTTRGQMIGADGFSDDGSCVGDGGEQVCSSMTRVILGPFLVAGEVDVDLLATWYDDRFLGQKWFLPPRNNNPSWLTKRKVCHDLRLVGDCDRFGIELVRGKTVVRPSSVRESASKHKVCTRASQLTSPGWWERVDPAQATKDRLLTDPFDLNSFNGSSWIWKAGIPGGTVARACSLQNFTGPDLEDLLSRHRIQKIALFGDSMMVEQFEMLRALLTGPKLTQDRSNLIKPTGGKWRGKTRWFQFSTKRGLTVRFMRGYTTDRKGASVISPASQVWSQLKEFGPDLMFGNLAVLHWQQNQRTLDEWNKNVEEFTTLLNSKLSPSERAKVLFIGATLIQMGRTAGLQPSRTQQFTKAAAKAFTYIGSQYVDPYWLSLPRRESAYDGQHWACYHEVGGVSHMISQLILNHVAVLLA